MVHAWSVVFVSSLLAAVQVTAAPIAVDPRFFKEIGDFVKGSAKALVAPDNEASVTSVDNSTLQQFVFPALMAQAAYCVDPVPALPQIDVLLKGGDGGEIPRYFVGHDKSSNRLVVAHQGTEKTNPLSLLNDAEFAFEDLDTNFFPDADSSIQVHDGFQATFARTADDILSAVNKAIGDSKVDEVVVSGHSLGAALAVMTSVFLKQQLGTDGPKITTVGFGLPRGGNQEWADFVDQQLDGMVHFHNKNDPVPHVPPTELGYVHPSGEHFIQVLAPNNVVSCPGQENENCSDSDSVLKTSLADHKGPYVGVSMGSKFCPIQPQPLGP